MGLEDIPELKSSQNVEESPVVGYALAKEVSGVLPVLVFGWTGDVGNKNYVCASRGEEREGVLYANGFTSLRGYRKEELSHYVALE